MAKWADTLEGLRCHAAQTDAVLLPTTSARPLNEIRRVLTEAQEFVSKLPIEDTHLLKTHLPMVPDRKAA